MSALGNKTRRKICPFYIAGLIGPGDLKSIQPMAAREADVGYNRLHHFVAAGVWGQRPCRGRPVERGGPPLSGTTPAFWSLMTQALPKKGSPLGGRGAAIRVIAWQDL